MISMTGCRQVVFVIWWAWKTHKREFPRRSIAFFVQWETDIKGKNWKAASVKFVDTDSGFCFWLMEQEIQTRGFNIVHSFKRISSCLPFLSLSFFSLSLSMRFLHFCLLRFIFLKVSRTTMSSVLAHAFVRSEDRSHGWKCGAETLLLLCCAQEEKNKMPSCEKFAS